MRKNIARLILLLIIILIGSGTALAFFGKEPASINFLEKEKTITVDDDGMKVQLVSRSNSVGELLEETGTVLGKNDSVSPNQDSPLLPGMNIFLKRAKNIEITADNKEIETWTYRKDIPEALRENGIVLGRLDKTDPEKGTIIKDGLQIEVVRINEEERTVIEDIDFDTVVKKDSELGWREKKVKQKGEKGKKEVRYKITYKNGEEISRQILGKEIVQEPTDEIVIQGTYVKIGKSHKGQGTWYAFKGGLYAASPWLPIGSYAKVTNRANGKSVIVEINDRGPFGDGRIIDLDKPAFQKIASLGTGVIDVKVEEILN